jgi:hypothetical protein
MGSPGDMYVFSFESGKEQRIGTGLHISSGEHCWSADGGSIFLNDKARGVRLDLKTNQSAPIVGAGGYRFANCAGDVVLARIGNGIDIWKGGERKEVFRQPNGAPLTTPVVSHDGKLVAYPTMGDSSILHVVSSDGGAMRDVVSEKAPAQLQPAWGLAWSSDDRFVYYLRRRNEKSPFELMRVPASGGVPEPMGLKGDDIRDLDVARDGTKMVFSVGAVNRPEYWELKGFLPKK